MYGHHLDANTCNVVLWLLMWHCGHRCALCWGCGTHGGHRCSTVVFVPFISCISSQTHSFEKYFGSYSVNFNSEELTRVNITKDTIPHVINSRPSLNVIIQPFYTVSQWCFVLLNRCFLRYQILEANRVCLYVYNDCKPFLQNCYTRWYPFNWS